MKDTSGVVGHFLIAQVRKPAARLVLDDQRHHARPHGQEARLVAHQPFQHREKITVWHGYSAYALCLGMGRYRRATSLAGVPAPTLAEAGYRQEPCQACPPRQTPTSRPTDIVEGWQRPLPRRCLRKLRPQLSANVVGKSGPFLGLRDGPPIPPTLLVASSLSAGSSAITTRSAASLPARAE